jgi:hypothetical protein
VYIQIRGLTNVEPTDAKCRVSQHALRGGDENRTNESAITSENRASEKKNNKQTDTLLLRGEALVK